MTRRPTIDRPADPRTGRRPPRAGFLAVTAMLALSAGCATLPQVTTTTGGGGHPLIPTRYQSQVGAFRVASNVPLAEDDPALAALAGLEGRLERILGIDVPDEGTPIDVYILDDEHAFTTFLTFHHPELPSRRAFFLAVGEEAAVYTARGEHLEEDLRHEATHALLHRAGGRVPLWLDEGLAEYFEVEPAALPGEAVDRFRRLAAAYRQGWRPDLRRLEAIDDVAEMTPTDYRESWAWAVLLLHGPRREALVDHLKSLRADSGTPPLISETLRDDLDRLNRQFLARVAPEAPGGGSPSLTRLQSPSGAGAPKSRPVAVPVEPGRRVIVLPAAAPSPGPIGRLREGIRGLFGRIIP
ncbi:hypothetical protein [Tautonia sociabilis]|uniref:DUF1570 domain-containing protein n=1 Tax=Tautonia sociabilis TaxID=2080755 RepID=A0A432MIZ4_9BACT|nr:hypothetical protein [Tautonia sociabilis]RUL87269.1 hypothetical protein TsocGM_12860 [Tautonia sociabilis]